MKQIPLTKGKEAWVDDEDYDFLMQWKWHLTGGNRNSKSAGKYAGRWDWTHGNRKRIYMHNVIASRINLPSSPDHRDRDGLNNQRCNLRDATNSQNLANRALFETSTSGFKGVTEHRGKWQSQIMVHRQTHYLGRFPGTEAGKIAAARAYNKAAREHFGEFAVLNSIPQEIS